MFNKNARQSVWTPWQELNNLGDSLTKMLGLVPEFTPRRDYPPVNVWKSESEIIISAKLPGVKEDDIDITINQDTLTIKCTRTPLEIPEGSVEVRRERNSGKYTRSFSLPFTVEHDSVKADYKNGILTIHLPKAKAEQPRKISVNSNRI